VGERWNNVPPVVATLLGKATLPPVRLKQQQLSSYQRNYRCILSGKLWEDKTVTGILLLVEH